MRRGTAVLWLVLSVAAPGALAAERPPEDLMPDWQERVEEAIDFVASEDPRLAQELMELRVHDPDAFMREIFHVILERKELERLSKTDQQRYLRVLKERELERRSHHLAREWHEAPDADKDQLKTQLRAILHELFDVRETHRSDQIAELERELERLRATLKARQGTKKSIVDSRLKEMLGEEDHLRW